MPRSREGDLEAYERLRRHAKLAEDAGRLSEALEGFRESQRIAERLGDRERIDRAACNTSAVRIGLGDHSGPIGILREIHDRSVDHENGFLAAYNLACAYYYQKEHGKALFYGRTALQRAARLDLDEWRGWGHNQLANILLALNRVDDATVEYEQALELLPPGATVNRGRVLDNLGYCRLVTGAVSEAFSLLMTSWRMLRRCGAQQALVHTHLDLAYAFLDVQRPRSARRHAERALSLADRTGLGDERKNALFLLGESCLAGGDQGAARATFDRLQELYPDTPYLADLLLFVDVRQLVNLKA